MVIIIMIMVMIMIMMEAYRNRRDPLQKSKEANTDAQSAVMEWMGGYGRIWAKWAEMGGRGRERERGNLDFVQEARISLMKYQKGKEKGKEKGKKKNIL